MRYGICILPEHAWHEAEPRWLRAEELGFDHAWTYDHLVWSGLPSSPWHSTVATLTAAAMVTDRIRLGTFVTSPNFRHPLLLAKDTVTLDDISGGRLILGMGAGGDRDAEILGAGVSRGQRTRRFREFVELLDRSLTEDHVDADGEFFSAVDGRLAPACVQQPRVPFVVAANGPKALALAARHGQGWVTTGPAPGLPGETLTLEQWWAGVADKATQLDAAEADAGRDQPLERHLSLDACGRPALSSAAFFAEQVARARELGFTDVVVHWPRPSEPYRADEAVLERLDLTR